MGVILLLVVSAMAVSTVIRASPPARASSDGKFFAVCYAASGNTTTSYTDLGGEGGVTISSTGGAVFCYVPETHSTLLVPGSEYTDISYAPNYNIPYTVDDRLFVVTMWPNNDNPGTGTAAFLERNISDGRTVPPGQPLHASGFWFYDPYSYAVLGNTLYFEPGIWYNPLISQDFIGKGLYAVQLSPNKYGKENELVYPGEKNDSVLGDPGTLYSAGGNLYRYAFLDHNSTWSKCDQACFLVIYQLNATTGEYTRDTQLALPAAPFNGTFRDWSFAADANRFYVAAAFDPRGNGNSSNPWDTYNVWVWTIPLSEFQSGTITVFSNNSSIPYWASRISTFIPYPPSVWSTESALIPTHLQVTNGDVLLQLPGYNVLYSMPPESCSTLQTCTGNYTVLPAKLLNKGLSLIFGAASPNSASNQTSTSSTSVTNSSETSSTHPPGGVPEFPYQVVGTATLAISIVLSYLLVRPLATRRSTRAFERRPQ